MSVTHDTGGSDNGKTGKAGTQSKMPAAVKLQISYGVISKTTPQPP